VGETFARLNPMRTPIVVAAMFLLTAVVVQTAVRVEVLNYQAGSYLPRTDRDADGSFADGQWRLSTENTPRDQLRGLVSTWGLLQYVLAPLLLIIAVVVFLKSRRSWLTIAATLSVVVAGIAISLALYREYYPSLTW
jgi:hypothetical protein